ncbi:cytochrome c oxidase subunit II [Salinibacillus xinjiangensis]|uniref:Cytochrome c oxidase subunit 2 n=1 Tax=Salinibacillus xinjiangensis TaxID=1229268 RepID=A0A6G1X3K8_9BACI|nr:cytochrome c oxidase subunit II [Salinibacillus xinjiangensis]MRG85532.1 cytochrome c oxidase subunit II [Salinibacillus xinjiangensis]
MKGWMDKFKALFLVSGIALILSGCGNPYLSALQPKGEGADMILDLMILSIVIMIFVFLIVMAIYTYVLVRFRQKKGNEDYVPKQVEGNHMLETLWTVIPIILLLILAVPTVQYTFALSDTTPETTEGEDGENAEEAIWIDVTGKQFWWNFDYRGMDIQTSQDLYIPTDRRVYLTLSSGDVIHSFWVPAVSGKMDVNPGKNENEMFLNATEEGVFWGHCAEFCGPSHSLMDFRVVAVSPGEFDQWVEEMQNVDPDAQPESDVAQEGKELFAENSCLNCHAIGSSPAMMGPNVTNFGDRSKIAGILDYNKENLVSWILNPDKHKPGNLMSGNYTVPSREDANKIAEYLMTLSPSEIGPDDAQDDDYLQPKKKEESNNEETENKEDETAEEESKDEE